MNPDILAALQNVANQFSVEINGTVTPAAVPQVFEVKPVAPAA